MVSFRKNFLLLTLLVAFAAVASAQYAPLTCNFSAGSPPIVRQEGLAEGVGQMVIRCSGGTPTTVGNKIPQVNIQIYLNVNITSRVLSNPWTEAMLLIDEPAPAIQSMCNEASDNFNSTNATCDIVAASSIGLGNYTGTDAGTVEDSPRPNIWQGRCTASSCATALTSSIVFLGVPVDPPGTGPERVLRIVNVRGNATQSPVSSTLLPSQIIAVVSVSGQGSLPIPNNQGQVVAIVQPGLAFSVSTGDLKQCSATNADAPDDNEGCYNVRLRFSENFGSAFMVSGAEVDQNQPGTIYNTESMFSNENLVGRGDVGGRAGRATQSTLLWARFSGLPAGIKLFASVSPIAINELVPPAGPDPPSGPNQLLAYIPSTDGSKGTLPEVDEVGSTETTCKTGSSNAKLLGWNNSPYYEVPISAAGTAAIAYEVLYADTSFIGSYDIGVMVSYGSSPLPSNGAATVNGNYAPVSTTGSMTTSTSLKVPRFIDNPKGSDAFTISSCRTNLLFTYLTSVPGWDAGISIANTSRDPFGTSPQTGNCTLNFYGTFTSDPTQTFYTQTTTTPLEGGQSALLQLSGGGTNGLKAVPGFTGYMIAQCDFQFAHGFAFISDFGATNLAQGYLANVMDTPGIYRTNNDGEGLAN